MMELKLPIVYPMGKQPYQTAIINMNVGIHKKGRNYILRTEEAEIANKDLIH
jgi:hypothetical protein